MVKARIDYLSERYDRARQGFLEARKLARESGDGQHLTHIEGDIGMCWLAQEQYEEARKWITRAVELARKNAQPALEASWLIELGRLTMREGDLEEADRYAKAALRIVKPREHHLSIFRAEWLRHLVARRARPNRTDRHRLAYLRKLFLQLDQHDGHGDIQDFKRAVLRSPDTEDGTH
jgi:tetratricopeptide (TPR) repeat protein